MKNLLLSLILSLAFISRGTDEVAWNDGDLHIVVRDGVTRTPLTGTRTGDGKWEVAGGLTVEFSGKDISHGRESSVRFRVAPKSETLYKLSVEASRKIEGVSGFFDGFAEHVVEQRPLERISLGEFFPLAVAWNAKRSFSLGLPPDTVVGYMHSALVPGKNDAELRFSVRIVADRRREQTAKFTRFDGDAVFEWREAVEACYQSYPAFFRPADGIDPRIYGVGGYLTSNHRTRDLEIHAARQFLQTWEWTYVPWNRAGEWYVDPEDWRPGDGYFWYDGYMKNTPCSYEDYHKYETSTVR